MHRQFNNSLTQIFHTMKIQSPWMGRIKGSAGNMTGCKNYDKNVLRAKAFEVSNPKTDAQTNQRIYFAVLSALVATFNAEQLRTIFPSKPKAMSRRNALSKQLAEDVTTSNGQKVVDFANINTIGNAGTMDFGTTTCVNTTGTIAVTLDNAVKGNTELGDNFFITAIVNNTTGEIYLPITSAKVSVGTLSIAAPESWQTTDTIHAIPLITDAMAAPASFGTMVIIKRPARA